MRTALALSGIFVVSVVLLTSSSRCTGAEFPGPSAPPLTVILAGGDTLQALRILPSGLDMLRVDTASGPAYFTASHIRLVLDATGADRTRDALDRRRFLGDPLPPSSVRPGPSHYGPRSVSRTFMLTETSAFVRVGEHPVQDRGAAIQFDLGRGVNLGPRDAVAMSVFVGASSGADLGVRYRYRRWLGRESSFDIGPGLILLHGEDQGWKGRGVGLVGQAALNVSRIASIGAQVFTVPRERPGTYTWFGAFPTLRERDTGLMLGIKVGGQPGLVTGIGTAFLTYAVSAGIDETRKAY